jgi:hypothetical protein
VTLTIGRTASIVKPDGTNARVTVSGTRTATKTVNVLPVPAADVTLAGPHKANRTERMVLDIHTHPDRPLRTIELTVTDESGKTVHYRAVRDMRTGAETVSGQFVGAALPQNTRITDGRVCARSLENTFPSASSGRTREVWELPFLTKNGSSRTYRYSVTVTDTGGYTNTASGAFIQNPDAPPAAAIALADFYTRGETGNTAAIEVTDATPSDGDRVERTWAFADSDAMSGGTASAGSFRTLTASTVPALSDRSFGTGKTVSFDKTGVGAFAVRLTARDVWTEETLPEFVTPADVLTGEAVAASEVRNLAPRVSVSVTSARPRANFLFLARSEEERAALESSFPTLEAALRAGGLSPVLSVRTMSPLPASSGAIDPDKPLRLVKNVIENEYGYEGAWTFLSFAAAVDELRLYTVTGTFAGTGLGDKPAAPYTIRAYAAATGAPEWAYTLTDSVMRVVPDGSWHSANSRIVTDLAGRYVFLRSGTGKTLVLDARTGSYLTVLDTNIGGGVYSDGDTIWFYRADGLWEIDARTGGVSLIERGTFLPLAGQGSAGVNDTVSGASGGIGTAAFLDRGLFVAFEDRSGTIVRTAFDPKTGTVARTALTSARGDWTVIAFDTEGTAVLHSSGLAKMAVFTRGGTEICRVGVASRPSACAAARDENGVCRYVSDGRTAYYSNYFGEGEMGEFARYVYDVSTGRSVSYYATDPFRLYLHTNNAIFSVERNGRVFEAFGAYRSYVYGLGYGGYSEEAALIVSNFRTRSSRRESLDSLGLDAIVELGGRSDAYLFARSDSNTASRDAFTATRILAEPRTEDRIIRMVEARNLRTDGDLNLVLTADKADAGTLLALAVDAGLIERIPDDPASPWLTLRAGETAEYTVAYTDPESDPSKESRWRYTYTDPSGRNGAWTREYAAPLASFSRAGRYLLEHWQVDDTGDPAYDLESNVLRLLIYVTDGNERPVIPKDLGPGVHHTDEWERNRLLWNERYPDRARAENVFWAGERLVCVAAVEGDARSVTAELKRANGTAVPPSGSAKGTLSPTGGTDANGVPLYRTELWDESWIDAFGRNGPEPFIVTFTSVYADGTVLSKDVPIVFDTQISFFQLYRMW